MTTFDGAVISEQGVKFGLLVVKPRVLHNQSAQSQMRGFGTKAWGRLPIVLMAQDSGGVPTYNGRPDIVRFLANIDMHRIPFKRWTVN
jgi:hypothetical protein